MDQSFIREVDEDYRLEQMRLLWQRYGRYVIGVSVLAVVLVGLRGWWMSYVHERLSQDTAQLMGVPLPPAVSGADFADAGAAARARLSALEKDGFRADLRALAALGQARLSIEGHDGVAATEDFRRAAAMQDAGIALRELGRLGLAVSEAPAGQAPAIRQPAAVFTATAKEWEALAALQAGNKDQARRIYQGLVNDMQTPSMLYRRAQESLARLGGPMDGDAGQKAPADVP